ncbi:MAG: hypothetical protein Q4G67_13635, partial [Actinomycetia bacterium]|nr:hypothetical protein [Actinomycetes bacterium]
MQMKKPAAWAVTGALGLAALTGVAINAQANNIDPDPRPALTLPVDDVTDTDSATSAPTSPSATSTTSAPSTPSPTSTASAPSTPSAPSTTSAPSPVSAVSAASARSAPSAKTVAPKPA